MSSIVPKSYVDTPFKLSSMRLYCSGIFINTMMLTRSRRCEELFELTRRFVVVIGFPAVGSHCEDFNFKLV